MSDGALVDRYDLVILDLDGVVYLLDRPIEGAVAAIGALHDRGTAVAYATNNASRTAAEVAGLLTRIGVPADPAEVLTSAQAAAVTLARRHPPGSPVLAVGAPALRDEVSRAGLTLVGTAADSPRAVVQGYGPQVCWADLAEACVAVRSGADWVATNTDATLPTPRGPLPGNGALVAALATALGREPDVIVGKPAPGLFATAAQRAGARRPLVVGDRLDTDIEGAVNAGLDSLLVLTGVTTPRDLLTAPPHRRPTHIATDLSGLFTVEEQDGWQARSVDGRLELTGTGRPIAALRTLCAAAWETGSAESAAGSAEIVPGSADSAAGSAEIVPGSAETAAALAELGLTAASGPSWA